MTGYVVAMTTDTHLEKVLAAIRSDLGDPATWGAPVEMQDSLALCALNSAYSLQNTSAAVRNVLRRYREHRINAGADPSMDSGPDLIGAMNAAGGARAFSTDVLETRAAFPKTGRTRSEAIYDALSALADLGVTTTQNLRDVAHQSDAERAWCSVKGLGEQSWAYLLMNAGDSSRTKPDTMVRRFLARATGSPVDAVEATRLVTEAAAALGVELRNLDRAIWLHESPDRSTGSQCAE